MIEIFVFNCSLSIASWSVLTGALSKGLGLRLSRSPRSNPGHFEYRRRQLLLSRTEGGAIAPIVTTFSPGQAGLLHLTVQQPLGKEMNRLISNKSSFYSFGGGFLLVQVWWGPETPVPADFAFCGESAQTPSFARGHAPRWEGGTEKHFLEAGTTCPTQKELFFFFLSPSLAEPVSSEIQSDRRRNRRRDEVVEMVWGYEGWEEGGSDTVRGGLRCLGKKKREAAERGMAASGCLYFMWTNSNHQVSESVFLRNRHLAGFGFCLFLRQNFGSFQQFGQGERQPESEGMRGLCIPGEEAIQRGETETVNTGITCQRTVRSFSPPLGSAQVLLC